MNRAGKAMLGGVAVGAVMLGAAFGLQYLKAQGFFPGDAHEFKARSIGVIMGIFVVYLANSIPKTLIPLSRSGGEPAFAQSLRRFNAAILVVGALVYTGAWLFAPIKLALPLSIASLGGATAVVFVAILICGISQAKAKG